MGSLHSMNDALWKLQRNFGGMAIIECGMGKHCRDILGGLNDYLDDEAGRIVCERIERHLADCPACRVVVDTTRRTVRFYRESTALRMPEMFELSLHAVLRQSWEKRFGAQ